MEDEKQEAALLSNVRHFLAFWLRPNVRARSQVKGKDGLETHSTRQPHLIFLCKLLLQVLLLFL